MSVLLSDRDVEGVLDFLYQAGEVDGPEVFTTEVLVAFAGLIPNHGGACCNVFADLDPRSRPEQRTVLDFGAVDCEWTTDTADPCGWTDEFDEVCRLYVAKDEAIPPRPRYMFQPTRVSDILSYREQRARELWWYLERHCGEEAVWLWLPAPEEGVLRRINFGAEKRGGISERDVRILELLTPHLVQLYGRAAARRATRTDLCGLTPREHEVMSLVAEGRMNQEIAQLLWLSPNTVRKHLENVFEKLGVTNRTAAVARVFGAPGQHANGAATNGHAARRSERAGTG
jgi:DNA-binding CsgD family transcriptional regulator